MYDLKIIDPEFNLLGAMDSFGSINLSRKLIEVGDIEIHANYLATGADLLQKGNIVFVNPKHPFRIYAREIEETTSGVLITARGKQLKGICAQRLTVPDAEQTEFASLITNGDFSNGTTGWVFVRVKNPSIIDGWINYQLDSLTSAVLAQDLVSTKWIQGNQYYIGIEFNNDASRNIEISEADYGTFTANVRAYASIPSGVQKFSVAFSANRNGARLFLRQYMSTLTEVCRFRNFIVINLTDAFGAGNEPTREQMDVILAEAANSFGYDRYPAPGSPDVPAETVMKRYVNKHLSNPYDTNRKIAELAVATDQGRGLDMRWSTRFEPIDRVLKAIGEYAEMGYDMTLDLANENFLFDVVPGVDHSAGSSNPVIFSVAFANVDSTKYTIDDQSAVTVAYAGGAGENEDRLIQAVNIAETPSSGLSRKEAWVDCGSVDTIDDLKYEAKHRMKGSTETETLTSDIATSETLGYGAKWDLGDIVTIQSVSLGISRDVRITEVRETYENGKRDINVTFGTRQRNILDEIRKTEVVR